MKHKILIFILSFTLLFSVFSISSFAEETTEYVITGDILLKSPMTPPNFVVNIYVGFKLYNVGSGTNVSNLNYHPDGTLKMYHDVGNNAKWTTIYTTVDGWIKEEYRHFQLVLGQHWTTDEEKYNWFLNNSEVFNGDVEIPEPDPTPDPDNPEQTECDGSSCPATDKNFDNVCDDCMLMFAVLRNYDNYDLYNYNGHSFPRKFTKSNGDTWYLTDIHNEIKSSYGSVVLLSNGNFDSSMVYVLVNLTNNPQTPLVVKNGQAVLTGGKTMVSLYKAEYDENGVPYWKFSATDTWSTEGALLANTEQIQWSMGNILDENGSVSIAGDVNFRSPLAEEIQGLTAGILKGTTLPAVMKVILTLLLCGVGCLAFLTVFILLRKVLFNSLRT